MKNISVFIPERYLELLERLKQEGVIANRAEGIRLAIFAFLKPFYPLESPQFWLQKSKEKVINGIEGPSSEKNP